MSVTFASSPFVLREDLPTCGAGIFLDFCHIYHPEFSMHITAVSLLIVRCVSDRQREVTTLSFTKDFLHHHSVSVT